MKNRIVLFSAFLFVFLSSYVVAENQYVIEGFIGKANQENTVSGGQPISGTESSQGVRFIVPLGRMVDLELSYADFGKVSDAFVDGFGDTIIDGIDTESFSVGVRSEIPIGRIVSLTGRIGLSFWDFGFTRKDSSFPGEVFRASDKGIDTYVGFGLQFDIEDNFRVAVEYMYLGFDADLKGVSTDQEIKNVALSLGYRF